MLQKVLGSDDRHVGIGWDDPEDSSKMIQVGVGIDEDKMMVSTYGN